MSKLNLLTIFMYLLSISKVFAMDPPNEVRNPDIISLPCMGSEKETVFSTCFATETLRSNNRAGFEPRLCLIVPLQCDILKENSIFTRDGKDIPTYVFNKGKHLPLDMNFIKEYLKPVIIGGFDIPAERRDNLHLMNCGLLEHEEIWECAYVHTYSINFKDDNNKHCRIRLHKESKSSRQKIDAFDGKYYKITENNKSSYDSIRDATIFQVLDSVYISVAFPVMIFFEDQGRWEVFVWDLGVEYNLLGAETNFNVKHNFLRPLDLCGAPVQEALKNHPKGFHIVEANGASDRLLGFKNLLAVQNVIPVPECISSQLLDHRKELIEFDKNNFNDNPMKIIADLTHLNSEQLAQYNQFKHEMANSQMTIQFYENRLESLIIIIKLESNHIFKLEQLIGHINKAIQNTASNDMIYVFSLVRNNFQTARQESLNSFEKLQEEKQNCQTQLCQAISTKDESNEKAQKIILILKKNMRSKVKKLKSKDFGVMAETLQNCQFRCADLAINNPLFKNLEQDIALKLSTVRLIALWVGSVK